MKTDGNVIAYYITTPFVSFSNRYEGRHFEPLTNNETKNIHLIYMFLTFCLSIYYLFTLVVDKGLTE